LWLALLESDWDTAYALSGPLQGLIGLQTSVDSFVAVEKHLLILQGVIANAYPRKPQSFVLDDETRAEAERLFRQISRVVAGAEAR
jgi:4-hydroxy-tetrahydrodipicolinate synthase